MEIKASEKRGYGFWLYWSPVFSYMFIIFFLSSQSSFSIAPPSIPYIDKICHLIEFSLLSYLLVRCFLHSYNNSWLRKNAILLGIVITILVGFSDEFHQYFVPLRCVEIMDLVADSLGAFIGGFGYLYLNKIILTIKRKKLKWI